MAQAIDSEDARRASMRATSVILLAVHLLTLGHLLFVRHAICPEHGEAIHSDPPSEDRATPPSHEGAGAGAALASGAPTAEHAHDHCLARASTRERFALLPTQDVMPVPPLLAVPLLSPVGVGTEPAVAVLLLAPKNSPPAA